MAMSDDAISDLEKLIKKARQKDLPFGLCLGKKPEDNVMILSLKKSGDVLMRQAKQEGETGKVTYGMVSVQGKIMSLTLEGKELPGLAKNMKIFLNKINLKMKVVILDASGNELESDGDEDLDTLEGGAEDNDTDTSAEDVKTSDDAETNETEAAAPPTEEPGDTDTKSTQDNTDPQAEKWAKVSAALDPRVKAFAASNDPKAPAIAKAWEGGVAAAQKGDYRMAMAVATKISPVVTAATAAPQDANTDTAPETDAANTAPNPDAEKWARLEGPMDALFTEVMKLNPPDASRLRSVWMAATESAENNDFTKAVAIATRLKPMLDAAKTAGVSAQDQEIPKDVVPFHKSKLAWESARGKMKDELDKLVKAIQAACANDEELKDLSQNAAGLTEYLMQFDERLENALEDIIASPPGAQRDALKKQAVGIIDGYRGVLSADFFKDVDENNGFANVKVTATASASLAAISKVLAA